MGQLSATEALRNMAARLHPSGEPPLWVLELVALQFCHRELGREGMLFQCLQGIDIAIHVVTELPCCPSTGVDVEQVQIKNFQ
ncbi:hypothetical protein T4E_7981 [Trichinella pseudospiralis]|uniref:Uncharacterized protein n=1 Tax=Trichinella pseudospiralis TaxID=6337 RepID=A0A0V0XQN4_TRIPS|nr:hypothetical protein T4E_7981 [Trichinella pseudospiralis]